MNLLEIKFASLLSYSPHGTGEKDKESKKTMCDIKGDRMHEDMPMSESIAKDMGKRLSKLPFADYFTKDTALVPAPKSSLPHSGSLWVPQRLADSMQKHGMGISMECLTRRTAVPQSSTSIPSERPKPQDHYKSMKVVNTLDSCPTEIVIVDDVITRGATLIGAANKLTERFPDARIRGFAALRTVSDSKNFKDIFDPFVGRIVIRNGNAFAERAV